MLYVLMCRLGRPAVDYPTLSGAVQSVAVASWPFPDASWLLESEHTAEVIRDAIEGAIEPGDLALVFPTNVGPARWTPLRDARYGRQFLQSALEREQATRA
ncbi:MAG: hypothetical protein WD734_03255 [Dehalococcoidia bacterium]